MNYRKIFVTGLVVLLLVSIVSWLPSVVVSAMNSNDLLSKVAPQLLKKLEGMRKDEVIEVVIRLKPLPKELSMSVKGNYRLAVNALKSHAKYTQKDLINLILSEGGVVLNKFWLDNVVLAKVPVGLISKIASLPEVVRIFENFEVHVIEPVINEAAEAKTNQVSSWGIFKIRAPEAWTLGFTGEGVRIAVLDTGVDITHPALAGKMLSVIPGDPYYPGGWMEFDSAGNPVRSIPHDTHGHGTHTSGTALGGNRVDILIGVAPGATLMHGLVLPGGGGTFAQVLAGMQWTVEPFYLDPSTGQPVYTGLPAHVVSMSWGANEYYGNELLPAVEAMLLTNIVPVAAIGNSGQGTTSNPGNIWGVFGVGATDINDNVASWSSGKIVTWPSPPPTWPFFDMYPSTYIKPDLSAPGVGITSAVPGGGYEAWSGTSMATPHVSGTVALILQAAGWLSHDIPDTPEKVYLILNSTAIDFGNPGQDIRYGWGRIDAYEAVRKAMEYAKKSGVEGFVRDSLTEEPIPWATVTVAEIGRTFQVNASGYYRIPLDPGTYTLIFEAWGYKTVNVTVEVVLLNGTITGIVYNALTGAPIAGGNVTVIELNLTVQTNATGAYVVSVPPGTYTLQAVASGYSQKTEVVTVDENQTVIVNFGLYPLGNGTIAGHVYDAVTNAPIAGAAVWTYVNGEAVYNLTDTQGYYELSVPSGNYTVYAWKPGYVQANVTGVVVGPLQTVIVDFHLQPIPPTVVVLANVDYYTRPHLREIIEALGLPVSVYNDTTQLLTNWVNGLINPKVIVIDHMKPNKYTYPTVNETLLLHLLADASGTTLIWLGTSYSGYTGIDVLFLYNSTLVANGYPAPKSKLYYWPSYTYVQATILNLTHPIFNGVNPDIPPNRFYVCASGYCDYEIYNFTDPTGRLRILAYVNDTRTGYARFGVGVAEWISNTGVSWYYLGSWAESYWVQYIEPGADGVYSSNTKKVLENAVMIGWSSDSLATGKPTLSKVLELISKNKIFAERRFESYIYTRTDVYMERLPYGYVSGTVKGSDGAVLAGATVQFIGTPVKIYTNETGQFFTWLPAGNYTALVKMPGYKSLEINFSVGVNETTDLGVLILKRLPRVAILYDYAGSIKSFLESMGMYAVDYTSVSALTNDILAGIYDAVVWAGDYGVPFPTYGEFMNFLNATHQMSVGVVWMDSWGSYGYGIKVLNRYLSDPSSVGYTWGYGEVYIKVTEAHPILKGYKVGDLVKIVAWASADFSWFSGFSGVSVADTYVAGTTWGNSVAWKEFPDGVKWALLSSFPPTSWNTPEYLTPDAWNIIYNAVRWVMLRPMNVTLENPYLHVGDEALLHVSRAPANKTLHIYLDGVMIGEVTSDSEGRANFIFTVPLVPGGKHLIEVYDEDEMYYGYTSLYVLVKTVITPTETTSPGLVRINVTGLQPYQVVMIYLDGNWLSNYRANMLGTFEIKVNIPLVVAGEHKLNILDPETSEVLSTATLTITSKLDEIGSKLDRITSKLDEIRGSITGVSEGIVTIKTSLGEIQVSLNTILTNLSVIDGKLNNISNGVVTIQTRLGEIQVSSNDLLNALISVNASLSQIIITSKGEILGVISTSRGDVLASIDVVKNLIQAGLPVDTKTLLNTLTSLINDKSSNMMSKLGEIQVSLNIILTNLSSLNTILTNLSVIDGKLNNISNRLGEVQGGLNTTLQTLQKVASKTDVSDLSSKVEAVGQKVDASTGTLSTYGIATVGLVVVTLIASIFGIFFKRK